MTVTSFRLLLVRREYGSLEYGLPCRPFSDMLSPALPHNEKQDSPA
jgi:hypothetical protein